MNPPEKESDSERVRRQARPIGEEASGYRVGSVSTVASALVVNALVAEVACLRMAAGANPAVLRSQNLPGSERGADSSLPWKKAVSIERRVTSFSGHAIGTNVRYRN
jgi:hypothetical protein